jgi:hypothetical protein
MYTEETSYPNPVGNAPGIGWDSPQAAAVIILGSMLALYAIRRGFRGVNVGGVSVGIR